VRYGLFGDVHGNLEALDAVLKALDKERCDQLVCLGDIIGYGANPKECLDIVRSRGIVTVAGNHDLTATGKFDINAFNSAAREAILYSIARLTPSDQEYLSTLPLINDLEEFAIVHSSPLGPADFEYIFTVEQASAAFEAAIRPLTFIGHSHVPVVFYQDPGLTDFTYASEFFLRRRRKIIFNCGSVGQPRDGDPAACYAVFETAVAKIRLERVPYDVDTAAKKIINAGLPLVLADRLYKGY
jgi:diadenosine tetraphosphatase ApaH/serine/threonine PP2A family protein phosphatase